MFLGEDRAPAAPQGIDLATTGGTIHWEAALLATDAARPIVEARLPSPDDAAAAALLLSLGESVAAEPPALAARAQVLLSTNRDSLTWKQAPAA